MAGSRKSNLLTCHWKSKAARFQSCSLGYLLRQIQGPQLAGSMVSYLLTCHWPFFGGNLNAKKGALKKWQAVGNQICSPVTGSFLVDILAKRNRRQLGSKVAHLAIYFARSGAHSWQAAWFHTCLPVTDHFLVEI